jgi:hypothetical protein
MHGLSAAFRSGSNVKEILGLKMFQALDRALKQGRERAMILGNDSPTLPSSISTPRRLPRPPSRWAD